MLTGADQCACNVNARNAFDVFGCHCYNGGIRAWHVAALVVFRAGFLRQRSGIFTLIFRQARLVICIIAN